MSFAQFAIEKRVISALMSIVILVGGYLAYTVLPRFEDPEFTIRQVKIITPYSGASAAEVANEVTEIVENAAQQLQGLKEVESVSSFGMSNVTVEFTIASSKSREQLSQKFTQLRAKMSDIANKLPPGAGPITVFDDFGDVYALYYAVTGEGFSLIEIRDYAKTLQKELVLVDGVSKVELVGVPEEVIYVEYSLAKLVTLNLSSDQVAEVLQGQNLITSAGGVDAGSERLVIRPIAAISDLKKIEELVITDKAGGRSFRLRDIATVRKGLKEPTAKRIFRDGKPAIGLGVSITIGGNVVNTGDAVNARIAKLENLRPLGIELAAISDQSISVRTSVNDFVTNVALALIIVVGTLLVFMGIRSGLLMGGILLVTVAGTLIGMYLYGLDMQRISLGALIIALGMLVDNAIVVVEGTLVRVDAGESPASASIDVVSKTKIPLLGGTIVGFLAFSPIGFSPDNTGEYAGSLFWTMMIALMFSWLVAIWLTPYYCTLMLKTPKNPNTDNKENFIVVSYRKLLELAVRRRWITMGLVVVLFISALASFSSVKQGFFPASTRPQFVIDYKMPEGSNIDQTTADIQEISKWVRTLDGVTGANTSVGGGHIRFMLTYTSEDPNSSYAQILVDVSSFDLVDELLPQVQAYVDANYLSAVTKVWKFILGPGGGSIIEARFTGPDPTVLRELSEQTKSVLSKAGAIAVKDDWNEMIKVVRPKINEENASRVGLSQNDISKAIAAFFDGAPIGVYREGDELLQIIFRPNEKDRDDIKDIRNVQIFSKASGRYVPITQVVDSFDIVLENANMHRFNRALAITAQADPAPGVDGSALFASIRPHVEAIELPDGYNLEWRGEYGNSKDASEGLATTMPFGFGAMILVVILLFNAVRQPLIIFLIVPLAMIGVIYGLIGMNTPMEFMATLGVLSLTGMLIKNALVLIDQTDTEIAEGKARMSAVIDASVSRMRPVTLGVMTTVFGVVPLLWDPFFRSLAVVIIFGLSFATILTLIVAPTLYAIFFRVSDDEVEKVEETEELESFSS
ncbi:MAG: efflux RND transporter permease subunit [Rhizobiaceae bacterium]|nr:efflux RND transporter permease subunit [Rhizobiaceae bacterium]